MGYDFLKPGFFVKLQDPDTSESSFLSVESAEYARYVHRWQTSAGADDPIAAGAESAEQSIENLKPMNMDYLYECVFGIRGPAYVYLNLPLETRLWGTGKKPIATSSNRRIGYLTQEESPWEEPTARSLFYLMKGGSFEYPSFTAYNPSSKSICPELDIHIMKALLKPVTEPDTLEKLQKKLIPYRPVTFGGLPPVRSGPG